CLVLRSLSTVYTLSLHDALPILQGQAFRRGDWRCARVPAFAERTIAMIGRPRSFAWSVVSLIGVLSLDVHGQVTSERLAAAPREDRKSTRLNSSHGSISYAVFCL